MFYDHAESTRRLIEELGGRAFRDLNYDAMQGAGVLIEAYLLALDQEDDTALDRIDTDVRAWIEGLTDEAQASAADRQLTKEGRED
ncbi:hypothetical protein MF271_04885 [Deinococcus sp. KNUC1210]|uniref:hypothetical protein n=1 Tax=Deinococcus sp. KNUC1210 TaxID=2917691 RepID=UPI001EF15A36|nr:hypothetical protein [Deinococcus sp. KNUC1210]ULH15970.1 hypothetical protein MF271_04885 [Deinococcus sp. KNUC1210]